MDVPDREIGNAVSFHDTPFPSSFGYLFVYSLFNDYKYFALTRRSDEIYDFVVGNKTNNNNTSVRSRKRKLRRSTLCWTGTHACGLVKINATASVKFRLEGKWLVLEV